MAPSYDDTRNGNREHNNSRMNTNSELKIGDEFLKILQDNAFNGMDGGYITDHIAKVLENTSFRNHVFSNTRLLEITLWRCQDMVETTITWSEVNDKFFHKYNPLSRTCNRKIPDDLDNGPNKISTVERTPDSMSCIYHELFNSKDRRWTITRTKNHMAYLRVWDTRIDPSSVDLDETMIWYNLKKICVELIRAF
ncbi:hypothetical protein Tco_0908162 [Tanacetum coccineum]|uniref:Uncharacterized protein n=1 Tax=Tanacetum coccineum TaxID=301880 RepID=A0ABQ5CP58_9ASTR